MEGDRGKGERLKKAIAALRGAQKTEAAAGRYIHLGLTLAASTLLFFYAGFRLDRWLGSLPIFSLLGTFLGAFGGFLYLYRELTAGERERKRRGS